MNNGAGDNVAEPAGQLAGLDALESDLSSLGGLIDDREPQDEEVDLFELLNLWWQEDIHSRLLTWLLDPSGNHGLDDYFLVNFLLHSTGQAPAGGRRQFPKIASKTGIGREPRPNANGTRLLTAEEDGWTSW